MDLIESAKMAVKTLTANKLRSALTMLGIIIGNASVIAMVGVGQGAQRYATGQFKSLGPNVLFVVPGTDRARNRTFDIPNTLVLEDAEAIASQVPTIKEVAPQLQAQRVITQGNLNRSTLILGTTPAFTSVRDFTVSKGRFLTDADLKGTAQVVVVGSDIAKNLLGGTNQALEKEIRIENASYRVIGVLTEKGAFLGNNQDDIVVIPLSTMSSRVVGRSSPYGTTLTFISASARDEASVGAAKFQMENLLRLRHKITDEDDFTVRSQKDALKVVTNVTNALTLMFVGGIGIMNIMLVSVTERTKEIGLRKAIGASQQDILVQFIIEAVILSALGGLLGAAIGMGGTLLVGKVSPLKAGVSPAAVGLAVSVSGAIGLFFGVVPAQRAAKLDPIVALRSD